MTALIVGVAAAMALVLIEFGPHRDDEQVVAVRVEDE